MHRHSLWQELVFSIIGHRDEESNKGRGNDTYRTDISGSGDKGRVRMRQRDRRRIMERYKETDRDLERRVGESEHTDASFCPVYTRGHENKKYVSMLLPILNQSLLWVKMTHEGQEKHMQGKKKTRGVRTRHV